MHSQRAAYYNITKAEALQYTIYWNKIKQGTQNVETELLDWG